MHGVGSDQCDHHTLTPSSAAARLSCCASYFLRGGVLCGCDGPAQGHGHVPPPDGVSLQHDCACDHIPCVDCHRLIHHEQHLLPVCGAARQGHDLGCPCRAHLRKAACPRLPATFTCATWRTCMSLHLTLGVSLLTFPDPHPDP